MVDGGVMLPLFRSAALQLDRKRASSDDPSGNVHRHLAKLNNFLAPYSSWALALGTTTLI